MTFPSWKTSISSIAVFLERSTFTLNNAQKFILKRNFLENKSSSVRGSSSSSPLRVPLADCRDGHAGSTGHSRRRWHARERERLAGDRRPPLRLASSPRSGPSRSSLCRSTLSGQPSDDQEREQSARRVLQVRERGVPAQDPLRAASRSPRRSSKGSPSSGGPHGSPRAGSTGHALSSAGHDSAGAAADLPLRRVPLQGAPGSPCPVWQADAQRLRLRLRRRASLRRSARPRLHRHRHLPQLRERAHRRVRLRLRARRPRARLRTLPRPWARSRRGSTP